LPQLLFMLSTFFYMDIMIFVKWGISWHMRESQAPSLISTLINMFLQPH
jgi:hypothetical protein